LNHIGILSELDPLNTSVVTLNQHCDPVQAADVLPSDIIFFANTYVQGLSHVGIVTEAGGQRYINSREPRAAEDRLVGYWADHFSHYGRPHGLS